MKTKFVVNVLMTDRIRLRGASQMSVKKLGSIVPNILMTDTKGKSWNS